MFDARLRPVIDPALNWLGVRFARIGVTANSVTLVGALLGIGAGACITQGAFGTGLLLLLLSRLLDGLDGAVARATQPTDFGGYLDIVGDFVFYTAIPLGFAFADPVNAAAAATLLGSFALTGVSFLAYATLAAKRGLETAAHGRKSFFYSTGLTEGTETIVLFTLMCLWPDQFRLFAYGFSALCIVTVVQRTLLAYRTFTPRR